MKDTNVVGNNKMQINAAQTTNMMNNVAQTSNITHMLNLRTSVLNTNNPVNNNFSAISIAKSTMDIVVDNLTNHKPITINSRADAHIKSKETLYSTKLNYSEMQTKMLFNMWLVMRMRFTLGAKIITIQDSRERVQQGTLKTIQDSKNAV